MKRVSIVDFGSYLPEKEVRVDFFFGEGGEPLSSNPLLRAPEVRYHVARDEHAAEMVERAARPMFDRLGLDPSGNVDILITNVLLPDIPITGCGAEVAQRLGCKPEWIVDLHNGGCASFMYMLKLVQAMMCASSARTALLCNVQNTAGQVFAQPGLRKVPQSAIPGDGCGVAYAAAGDRSPVLAVTTRNDPQCAMDMGLSLQDGRKYWEPGTSEVDIEFEESRYKDILERGNNIVPEVVREVCERIDVSPRDIDVLVTNQPNRIFLRNWRQALEIEPTRHLDTFDYFGNLYGAGVPVTLDHAVRDGDLRDGDLVVLAGFAHAGDFAAAAAMRWRAP